MKTAEEILIEMYEVAPYTISERLKPYLVEAMNVYAEQFKPKWISVEERLPDGQEEVLVYMPGYGAPIAVYFLTDLDENRLTWLNPFFITKNFNEVTHWMPLPQLPTI